MTTFLRTPYNYDMNAAGDESGLECKDPTLTKQSFAEEADINTIVKRFNLTGQLPQNIRMPTYADFEDIITFQEAMNAIVNANTAFMTMPADVRARFHNNPSEFVDFCSDPTNLEEARKLGLVEASDPRATLPTPPAAPPAKASQNASSPPPAAGA